jgi:L-methionine (R)-S-oxide reductase
MMTNETITVLTKIRDWCSQQNPELTLTYPVPMLGEGGTCSLFGELDKNPFDLQQALPNLSLTKLKKIQAIVDWVKRHTNVDWFGVYFAQQGVTDTSQDNLTKLAYFGQPSRAQFPLTEHFSTLSNNVSVALTGTSKVINNVEQHRLQGGEYYTCDPAVKSELCLPIFTSEHYGLNSLPNKVLTTTGETQKIVGIIDAECFVTDYFDEQQQVIFNAVSCALSEIMSTS